MNLELSREIFEVIKAIFFYISKLAAKNRIRLNSIKSILNI